MAWCLI